MKEIGIIAHIGVGGVTSALIHESMKQDMGGVIVIDELQRGIDITDLAEMKVKETQQMLATIKDDYPIEEAKTKNKKIVWRKGKKRTI